MFICSTAFIPVEDLDVFEICNHSKLKYIKISNKFLVNR